MLVCRFVRFFGCSLISHELLDKTYICAHKEPLTTADVTTANATTADSTANVLVLGYGLWYGLGFRGYGIG